MPSLQLGPDRVQSRGLSDPGARRLAPGENPESGAPGSTLVFGSPLRAGHPPTQEETLTARGYLRVEIGGCPRVLDPPEPLI